MIKLTFVGAGSTVFAKNVIGDCMCVEALRDSVFALYDIDAERLKESETILKAMQKTMGGYGKIECYCGVENRKKALEKIPFAKAVENDARALEENQKFYLLLQPSLYDVLILISLLKRLLLNYLSSYLVQFLKF